MLLHVLLAAHDPERLAALLQEQDVLVELAGDEAELWKSLRSRRSDLLILDDELLGGRTASVVGDARKLPLGPEVLVASRNDGASHRSQLLASGAFAVLNPAIAKEALRQALSTIVARRTEKARLVLLALREKEDERRGLADFNTTSPVMREFLDFVARVIDTDSSLLVQGETGVGKEYLSRRIHSGSPRSSGPFVAVNCSALSESLLESELFGHVEGAFTGARRSRRGYFEQAHSGTLFLDEVGELSPKLQVKLLRVLQDKAIQPVGAEEEFEVDVRVIAATNRDLLQEVEQERFRADLYYRLGVVTLEVPPLRNRSEDIEALVANQIEHFRTILKRPAERVQPETLAVLREYDWPGNVRELANVIERAVLLCEGPEIGPIDLPEEIRGAPRRGLGLGTREAEGSGSMTAREEDDELLLEPFRQARRNLLERFDRHYVELILRRCNGRVRDAAGLAGLNPRSLYEKMQRLGIRKEHFKLPR